MFAIGEVIVDDRVAATQFCCDLIKCKGGCCTVEGGRGAPLYDDEIKEIQAILPKVRRYLNSEYLRLIDKEGPFEGRPGNYATTCYDERACVFVMWESSERSPSDMPSAEEDGIAKCAIEHAWSRGEIKWRKPLSCHLFPIRIRKFGGDILFVEKFSECPPAYKKGAKEGMMLYDFLRDPLIRAYGEKWYQEFRNTCQELIAQGMEIADSGK